MLLLLGYFKINSLLEYIYIRASIPYIQLADYFQHIHYLLTIYDITELTTHLKNKTKLAIEEEERKIKERLLKTHRFSNGRWPIATDVRTFKPFVIFTREGP